MFPRPARAEIRCAARKNGAARRSIDVAEFDFGILGTTIPQQHSFFGAPWVTGLLGAGHVSGPTINQACATGARCLATAAQNLATGDAQCVLVITADKTSNGPHIYYPQPSGPGGTAPTRIGCSTTSPAIR